ncbi:uncharacterized protein LOC135923897 [Gordionus sp. m RMFG-2023]|uniref:uncharacterized protein LOC135923897 n=1 Tax=Gordionus sp. m RMFG-2023 TaxID=3053472 RepID=UPI0031FE1699
MEIKRDGIVYINNDIISRLIEKFITLINNGKCLRKLWPLLSQDLNKCLTDVHISHILQTYMNCLHKNITNNQNIKFKVKIFKIIGKFIIENEDTNNYFNHPNASHVVITYLANISDLKNSNKIEYSSYTKEYKKSFSLPIFNDSISSKQYNNFSSNSLNIILQDIILLVIKSENFKKYCLSSYSCGVINVIIIILSESTHITKSCHLNLKLQFFKKWKQIFLEKNVTSKLNKPGKLIQYTADESIFFDAYSSRITETMIEYLTEPNYRKVFVKIFASLTPSFMKQIALHSCGNFVLQKFLGYIANDSGLVNEKKFSKIYRTLAECSGDIYNHGYFGIFTAMAKACITRPKFQETFLEDLDKLIRVHSFKTTPPVRVDLLTRIMFLGNGKMDYDALITAKPNDISFKKEKSPTSYHGSSLLQIVLGQFSDHVIDTILLVPFLEVLHEASSLIWYLCNDEKGSRVVEAILRCGVLSRDQKRWQLLVEKSILPHIFEICTDKYGSRIFDTVWDALSAFPKYRETLVKLLSTRKSALQNNFFGNLIWRKYGMFSYSTDARKWMNEYGNPDKKAKRTRLDEL